MKNSKPFIASYAPQIAVILAGAALLFFMLWFRLGSLTHGNASDIEAATRAASVSWKAIWDNPLNAPYTVVQHLVTMSGHHGITSLRLISTMWAAVAAGLFYLVARQWHNMRVAILASWLFISSGWFLHISRLGSPEILWLTSLLALVVLLTPNKRGRQSSLALPSTLIILSSILYVPGMVWLVLAGVIVQRKNLHEAWLATEAGWLRMVSVVTSIAILGPLIHGLVLSSAVLKQWLGITPGSGSSVLSMPAILHNFVDVPRSLLLSSSFDAAHWLGHLPLLSAFEIAMLLLGASFYITHIRATRTRLIIVLTAVAWGLISIMGINAITLVVPLIYLLVAAGVAYILHVWLKVFPNNPVARSLGIGIIMFTVLLTSVYQTRSYFVAWRYDTATIQAFHTRL
jgi:hypothetical protein